MEPQPTLLKPGTQQPQRNPSTGVAYRTPKSISSFVAGFKSSATKRINEYRHIYDYIVGNPENWLPPGAIS